MAPQTQPPVFRTASPVTLPPVTKLSQPSHDVVLELLVHALAPVGAYRARLPKPHPRKRSKKRRRKKPTVIGTPAALEARITSTPPPPLPPLPPPPAIERHLLLGFNSVTRYLEQQSTISSASVAAGQCGDGSAEKPAHVAAVFLFRPMDDSIFSHLPTLCRTASLAYPDRPATRLVLLDSAAEKKVTDALGHVPQGVSTLALFEPPEDEGAMKILTDYVRENVEVMDVPWLRDAVAARWLGTQVLVQ